jgi:hypothetical protein
VKAQAAGGSSGSTWTPDLGTGLIVACSMLLAATVVVGRGVAPAAAMLAVLSIIVAGHRWILSWQVLLCLVIAVVLFVPIGRYTLAIDLPFGLELYRVAVALIVLVWVASLLIDPRVRLRRTPLDGPVALIVVATLGSVAINFGRVAPLAEAVLKSLTLFLTFVIFFYFISSVVRTAEGVRVVTQFVVGCVAVVAFFSIVEQRTGFNLFDHVRSVFPLVDFHPTGVVVRYGLLRAFGSADHPIALGVLFAMTFPLGLALAKSRSSLWWAPTLLIFVGVLATASRTPILAMATVAVVFLWLRPSDVVPLLPLMIPMLIVIKIAVPGSIATVKNAFLPGSGPGLLAEQTALAADPTLISGRANFVPRLMEGMRRPLLGQGLGTRQTGADNPLRNSPILDNQWLGTFLDVGLLGLFGWGWLIIRIVRRLGAVAQIRGSPDGLLAAGFVASITGFAVAMFTYDSLAFVQEAVILWVLLALAGSLIAVHSETGDSVSEPAV